MNNSFVSKTLKVVTQNLAILLLCCSVSSCLILLVTGPADFENTQSKHSKKINVNATAEQIRGEQGSVYTLRGLLDIFSTGMNSLANRIHKELGLHATPISYLEGKRLSNYLIKAYKSGQLKRPIVLIGHSFGADTLILVAEELEEEHIPIDLLIAVDNTKKQIIPANVRTYYNINSGQSVFKGVLPWGKHLQGASKNTKIVNVDLIKDRGIIYVNHFNIDKLPSVQTYIIEIIKANTLSN